MLTFLIFGIILVAGIGILISCTSKQKKESNKNSTQAEKSSQQNPYFDMRKMALSVTPEQLGLQIPNDSIKVYGIIADLDMDGVIVTVVTYLTGEASMYLSSGAIIIGAGQHESVQKVTSEFVANAHLYSFKGQPFDKHELPANDNANFYFLSNMGQTLIKESIPEMENGTSEFSELFADLNTVITEIRLKSVK